MDKQKAQAQIAAILAELEKETGTIVKDIGLHSIDITTNLDPSRQWMMSVEIELERLPGHQWAT